MFQSFFPLTLWRFLTQVSWILPTFQTVQTHPKKIWEKITKRQFPAHVVPCLSHGLHLNGWFKKKHLLRRKQHSIVKRSYRIAFLLKVEKKRDEGWKKARWIFPPDWWLLTKSCWMFHWSSTIDGQFVISERFLGESSLAQILSWRHSTRVSLFIAPAKQPNTSWPFGLMETKKKGRGESKKGDQKKNTEIFYQSNYLTVSFLNLLMEGCFPGWWNLKWFPPKISRLLFLGSMIQKHPSMIHPRFMEDFQATSTAKRSKFELDELMSDRKKLRKVWNFSWKQL